MSERMILDREIVPAPYTLHEELPEGYVPTAKTAIPATEWLRLSSAGDDLSGVGVIVQGDTDLAPLKEHLGDVAFFALSFPLVKDGRSYSHARRLRTHWGYEGTLLAFGDVQRDQATNMARCGINAFYMRAGEDLEATISGFERFSAYYQYA